VTVKADYEVYEDQGASLAVRWTDGACEGGDPHDFTAASFLLEWIDYHTNAVVFETPSGDIAGGPPLPYPQANVVASLTAASLAGRAGLYRLRLIEDPAGSREVFRRSNLPIARIKPAPVGP
jgi:hypothetical protein